MGKSFKIVVDVDGIVTDTLAYWLDVIAKRTGIVAKVEDIKVWELHKNPALAGVAPKDIYPRLQDPGFIFGIPPIKGAVEFCKKLQDDGHQVFFVTARHGKQSMPETIEWFEHHMPWVNIEKQVNFLYDKENFAEADIIIDDKADTLIKYMAKWPDVTAMSFLYPYNAHLGEDVWFFDKDDNGWECMYDAIRGMSSDEAV